MNVLVKATVIGLLTGFLLISAISFAEDEAESEAAEGGEEAAAKPRPVYIPLKPPFVVNYGGPGRLRYFKAEVSVRVTGAGSANAVRHHMPYIRNNLVLLFSRQTDEDIDTQEGKERLRQLALEEIQTILEAEDGESGVVDLFFNNFVIQK